MVFTLAPKELQSTEHDFWGPCGPWWGFLSQHVPCALSSSGDPSSPAHPEAFTSELGVGREGGKGRGMMSGYNKSDFLVSSSRPIKAKINKMSHDLSSRINYSSPIGGFFPFITTNSGK